MARNQGFSLSFSIGIIALIALVAHVNGSFPYYGTKIGALKRLHHGVSGDVYAVDSRTIFIKKFNYDGEAPAAYFYLGSTDRPSNDNAIRLRDERGGTTALTRRYRNKDITLSLPDGKTLRDFKWFSVWCDEFAVNFGDVSIPSNLDYPRPQKITGLNGVHGVASDNIVIVDAQTLLVPNFSYDGEAPDAKFWVGRGQRPSPQGVRIPDENGTENPMRRYEKKTIVLTLPGDLTIFDIGHFGVWCEAFTVDFGHVRVPEGLNVPPSLKMLGISPQSKLNCEVLYDDLAFEVRWAVAGESIVVQLVAKLANNQYMSFGISPSKERSIMIGADVVVAWVDRETGKGYAVDYYLDDKSQCSGGRGTCPDVNIEDNTNSIRLLNAAMVNSYSIVTYQRSLQASDRLDLPISFNGSDAIVWAIGPLNERGEASFHTQYTKRTHFIEFGRQPTWNCPMPEGSRTSAPDDDEDAIETTAASADPSTGYPPTRRPALASEIEEEEFYGNPPQALQRPNNRRQTSQVQRTTEGAPQRPNNRRQASQNQLTTEGPLQIRNKPVPTPKAADTNEAWEIPAIQCNEPEDGVFYAQMGPTGGKHGYPAITGHVGWGISWYINGLLIPEIHVVRGKTYTFVVESGNNPDIPAKYHPFYITDDPVGGYEHKREEEKKAIRIFAGVHRSRSGQVMPIGVGRLCNWTPDIDGPPADDYQSFGAYQRTLTLNCEPGEPGVITWTPDSKTPDTVYYHCYTHRYLGWKIHVHDTCDGAAMASEKHETYLSAPHIAPVEEPTQRDEVDGLTAEPSIRHEFKVSPNDNFFMKHQTDLIKNHNMNGTPPKLSFEITKSSEITKLISDGIRAAEALEESILRNTNSNNNLNPNPNSYPNQKQQENQSNNTKKVVSNTAQTANGSSSNKILYHSHSPEILQGERHVAISSSASQHSHHTINLPPSPLSLHKPYHHYQNNPHYQTPAHHYRAKANHTSNNHRNNNNNIPSPSHNTIGLSEYLRPPLNAPLFHPVKLPGRRPHPAPLKKLHGIKPVLPQQLLKGPYGLQGPIASAAIPQPSVIVSHYRKPVPGLLRPFFKEKPFPIQPIAASALLLLGQPTELSAAEKHQRETEGVLVKVPYGDLMPQSSVPSGAIAHYGKRQHKPIAHQYPSKYTPIRVNKPEKQYTAGNATLPSSTPPKVFKQPFDMHFVQEEPASLALAGLQPATNEGFKPDTVVVESGFRPISSRDSVDTPGGPVQQVASRREDPGSEIDDVMETDTLFLTAQQQSNTQTQHFEPMFIPSPPDSTNATLAMRNRKPAYNAAVAAELRGEPAMEQADVYEEVTVKVKGIGPEDLAAESVEATGNEETITIRTERDSSKITTEPTKQRYSTTNANANRKKDAEMELMEMWDDLVDGSQLLYDNDAEADPTDSDADADAIDLDDGDVEEAQAAERIDIYYLPPDNRKIPNANLPSGAVVTYDGKSVIDRSLVLPPKLDSPRSENVRHHHGLSKTEELIRTPQFAPYRGEIPQSITDFLSTERSKSSPHMEATHDPQISGNATTSTSHHPLNTLPLTPPSISHNLLSSPPISITTSSRAQPHASSSSIIDTYTKAPSNHTSSPRPKSTKLHLAT